MVAKIKSGKSLIGALNYNENKVKQDKAELLGAVGYYKDLADLNFYDKLLRLTDLAGRNERTKTNAVHISLNFAIGENLPPDMLKGIVSDYMQGIGFENQPYLVYRHLDAGHPHIHVVTTNIRRTGERISLHYLGQNQSEKVRKSIEVKYRLVKAEDQLQRQPDVGVELQPAEYGKGETKRMITNILGSIVHAYKFTSIRELNAVLQPYHIEADRGSKESQTFAKGGLVYWVLDSQGEKVGMPVKASSIYGKPTLKTLEQQFQLNGTLRKPFKAGMIKAIDEVINHPMTKNKFRYALRNKGIDVLIRQNEEGRIYGVTFIDFNNKVVFNGSDLGKEYSANLLSARFLPESAVTIKHPRPTDSNEYQQANEYRAANGVGVIDILFEAEHEDLVALNKFKKKKRKGLNL
jgi:hypothetical protein